MFPEYRNNAPTDLNFLYLMCGLVPSLKNFPFTL